MRSLNSHVPHPGSPRRPTAGGGFSFPKFSQRAEKFPGPNKQPHVGSVTGSSAACPGEALPWLQGGKIISSGSSAKARPIEALN